MIDHSTIDHAEANYQTALETLRNVGAGLAGAPSEIAAVHKTAQGSITKARGAVTIAQREIDRVLNDNDMYPVGRFEKASAAYEKAEEVVKQELARAHVAANVMGPMLEAAMVPRFVGSDQDQTFVRDEIKDIVNRSSDPGEALAQLATDPRYAGLVTSAFGRSLLLGRGMDERMVDRAVELVRSTAIAWTIDNGTPEQRAAAARVAAAETIKAAPMAAGSAFQMWLEEMGEKVRAAGVKASRQAR
jgi:hypothetical protein